MKIYIAECYDRHIDPVIKVYASLESALAYAKAFVHDNARYSDRIQEAYIDQALYYCRYSEEGDYVTVKEGVIEPDHVT